MLFLICAVAAEEAKDPTRTIPRAYIGGILTLVVLGLGTMIFAGAVGDWQALANINDPLPQAMKIVVGAKLERPFRAPLYPQFPMTALVIAVVSLIAGFC